MRLSSNLVAIMNKKADSPTTTNWQTKYFAKPYIVCVANVATFIEDTNGVLLKYQRAS